MEDYNKRNRATSKVHIPGYKDCTAAVHEGPRSLPATSEFFFRKKTSPDGFSPVCKVCHVKQATAGKAKALKIKTKLGREALIKLSEKDRKVDVPHLTRLVEQMTSDVGGIERASADFWEDVRMATPGSPHRLKAFATYFQLIVKNTEMGHADKPVELMTDEELAKLLDEKVPELAKSLIRTQELMESEDDIDECGEAEAD